MHVSIADIGSLATAVGVFFAGWQVAQQRTQTRTGFQDALWREQREVIAALPIDLVLMAPGDDDFDPEELTEAERRALLRYFDLSNEQAMFAAVGRIGPNTWYTWRDSITHHMRRPAFQHAWQQLGPARASATFPHLESVVLGTHRLARRHDPLGRAERRHG